MQSQIIRLEDKFDSYFMWGFGLVLVAAGEAAAGVAAGGSGTAGLRCR
jgi:hypothetical protein